MTLRAELDQFGELFKRHLNGSIKATLRWVTTEDVDWDNKTMTATDSDDLPYYNVLLGVGMMAVKPRINTDCLIAIVEGDEASSFLMMADEAELVEFNKGKNGGLTNTSELKTQLNKLTARIDALYDAINNGVPIAQDGGIGFQNSMKAILSQVMSKENFEGIEDSSITH